MFAVRPTAVTPGARMSGKAALSGVTGRMPYCQEINSLLETSSLASSLVSLTIPEAVESGSPFSVCRCQVRSCRGGGMDGASPECLEAEGMGSPCTFQQCMYQKPLGHCEGFS